MFWRRSKGCAAAGEADSSAALRNDNKELEGGLLLRGFGLNFGEDAEEIAAEEFF